MSIQNTSTTYRTISVSSDPSTTILSPGQYIDGSRTIVSAAPAQYIGNGYDTVRYLMPVQQVMPQQQMQYVLVNQAPQVMQQMVSPVYTHTIPSVSAGRLDESEACMSYQQILENVNGMTPSVFSHTSSSIKSPAPSVQQEVEETEEVEEVEEVEEEMVNIVEEKEVERVIEKVSQVKIKSEVREVEPLVKMDTRFFGELLAEVYRKNCDIYTCISEHVAKIRGRKHLLDSSNDYKMERENIEALIPKGVSELTKQQIRYLLQVRPVQLLLLAVSHCLNSLTFFSLSCFSSPFPLFFSLPCPFSLFSFHALSLSLSLPFSQTRMTADKSMRLLLTTFSSLREELIHMSDDLRRLESDKETLERNLSFKTDQVEQYDRLLEAVRENNRQLQKSLKESSSSQLTLENQLLRSHSTDSGRDFRIKELEGNYRALEKENEMLKQKLAGQCSSSTIQMKTEELSHQYSEQLAALRQEKDKELQSLQTQLTRITTEYTTEKSGDQSLQLRISQLLSTLEQREVVIRRQEEELRKLQQERKSDSAKNVTTTTITKKYRNQYPLLGLLTDDYQSTSPVKDTKTIVIKSRTGEMIKQEIITSP
uniref:POF1B helix-loop-helix domain-containing protein n=1 Tax=Esox lucius TaxID=8010 RepID=A0A3P8XN35_ESOLU